jgi:hypothetical protein
VFSQFLPQRGQMPQVSKVFQEHPQAGPHTQRADASGTHWHFGQYIFTCLIASPEWTSRENGFDEDKRQECPDSRPLTSTLWQVLPVAAVRCR